MLRQLATAVKSEFVEIGDVRIEVERRGAGAPLVLLPGEEALEIEAPFLEKLAQTREVFLFWPPGFGRSNRPDWITCMDDVAYVYLDVMAKLGLDHAPVIGCSLGGWIAAEMATKNDSRFSSLVLVDPYGVKLGGPTDRDIADIWTLHPDKVAELKWRNREAGKRDLSGRSDDELYVIARNIESCARLCWEPYMHNPKLKRRLHRIGVKTLFVWGANDGIVTPDYGRRYAALVPGSKFVVIPEAGHLPHVEQPEAFLKEVEAFIG
jgi:pimeloyl-ACP methyl ester carboxylesterase